MNAIRGPVVNHRSDLFDKNLIFLPHHTVPYYLTEKHCNCLYTEMIKILIDAEQIAEITMSGCFRNF